MVVCGEVESSYLDELSTLGKSTVAEFYQDRAFFQSELHPSDLPIQPATLNDLLGGDRFENAAIIRRLLEGKDKGPKRDAVLLNAGAGLFLAGKAQSISEGWFLATEVIESGRGLLKLNELAEASRSSVGG